MHPTALALEPADPLCIDVVEVRYVRLQVEHGRSVQQVEPRDTKRRPGDFEQPYDGQAERVWPARGAGREDSVGLVVEKRDDLQIARTGAVEVREEVHV